MPVGWGALPTSAEVDKTRTQIATPIFGSNLPFGIWFLMRSWNLLVRNSWHAALALATNHTCKGILTRVGYNDPTLRRLMRSSRLAFLALSFLVFLRPFGSAQQAGTLAPLVQNYVRVSAPKVILQHVRVIDGTGRASQQDQNVVIERGKITSVEAASDVPATPGVTVLD